MNSRPNPYVGPRPFNKNELLPARDRDVQDLRMALISARIMVLHSPSGAGKTSLLEARNGLRAELEEHDFCVRPTARVGKPLPEGVPQATNRYELSVLQSLAAGEVTDPAELAGLGLVGYLDARRAFLEVDAAADPGAVPERKRELLVFDQFEEILTADPADDRGRREFFDRVAHALEDPYRWALFVVREDYLGALEPWAKRLPTNLTNRFRIDLLDADGARDAIMQPAAAAGVHYDDDALDYLVSELLQTSVQRIDGTIERREGLWVEPVQLQAVCSRLWSRLASDDENVELSEAKDLGNVDTALADFYAEQVASIARSLGGTERHVRNWIGTRLISPQGIRTQVMRGVETTDGLDNRVLGALESAHIVRGEERRRIKWYELSHDRLVTPVRRDNDRWEREHLHDMQLQAALWVRQKEKPELLLSEEALPAAEAWAKAHDAALLPEERAYLARSQEKVRAARQLLEEEKKRQSLEEQHQRKLIEEQHQGQLIEEQSRRLRQTRVGLMLLAAAFLAVTGLGIFAFWKSSAATESATEAKVREITAGMRSDQARTLVVEQESLTRTFRGFLAVRQLVDAGDFGEASLVLAALEARMTPIHPSAEPDFRSLASQILGGPMSGMFRGPHDPARSAVPSPDGSLLLVVGRSGAVTLESMSSPGAPYGPSESLAVTRESGVTAAAWHPRSRCFATAGETVRLWSRDGQTQLVTLGEPGGFKSVSFDPAGGYLLAVSSQGRALVWSVDNACGVMASTPSPIPEEGVEQAALGNRQVTNQRVEVLTFTARESGSHGRLALWKREERPGQAATWSKRWVVDEEGTLDGGVRSAAFSPDGDKLVAIPLRSRSAWLFATAVRGSRSAIGSWAQDRRSFQTNDPETRESHMLPFLSATFNSRGDRLLSTSQDGTARVWSVEWPANLAERSMHPSFLLETPSSAVSPVRLGAWSRDGARVAIASEDRRLTVFLMSERPAKKARWETLRAKRDRFVLTTGRAVHLQFVPSGEPDPSVKGAHLLVTTEDGTIQMWEFDRGDPKEADIHALSAEDIFRRLKDRARGCLSGEKRRAFLGESPTESDDGFRSCQKSLHDGRRRP